MNTPTIRIVTLPITVNAESLESAIKAGNYTRVRENLLDPDTLQESAPSRTTKNVYLAKWYHFLDANELDQIGLKYANAYELLALGTNHPDIASKLNLTASDTSDGFVQIIAPNTRGKWTKEDLCLTVAVDGSTRSLTTTLVPMLAPVGYACDRSTWFVAVEK